MKIEKKILRDVIKEFTKTTGLKLELTENLFNNPDIDVELKLRTKNMEIKIYGEIKPWITKSMVGQILHRFNDLKFTLITRYITRELAEELKNNNIQFLDTAGNAFINIPPLFVYVNGNRINRDELRHRPLRLFRTAGLKVLFALLNKPELLNEPYRNIAHAGNTALGTVANVFFDLKNLGYLHEIGVKKKKLVKRDELLNKWIDNYNEILRPTILKGRYTTNKIGWWKNTDPKKYDIYWGGEIGANLMTRYLRPKIETIYTDKKINTLIIKNKFIRDNRGDIEVLHKFWKFRYEEENKNIAPPLLIYADLLGIPDERNIETAKRIYDDEILKLIE